MNNFIMIQAIGAIGYSLLALSYYQKNKKQILFTQIISYIFFTIHYYLLSGITGAICNFIGLLALVTIYIFEEHKLKDKTIVAMSFVLALLVINIMAFQNVFSIFPMIASVVVIISFLVDDESIIRKIGVIAAVCWLIYAIAYKSQAAIVFEVVTLVSVLISLLKNKKSSNNEKNNT